MSKFWEHYEAAKPHIASAADDIRHKVVEEGWFGRQTTGNISPWSAPEPTKEEPVASHNHSALYAEIWGPEPEQSDVYGNLNFTIDHSPVAGDAPAIEPPKTPSQEEGLDPDF
jgi:hypothetical protein